MYHFNYPMGFNLLHLNSAYLLITLPIGKHCKKTQKRRQDKLFQAERNIFQNITFESWSLSVTLCISMNQQYNSDLMGSVSWYMLLGILCLCEHPVLSCIHQSCICKRASHYTCFFLSALPFQWRLILQNVSQLTLMNMMILLSPPHRYHTVRHIAGYHVSVIAVMLLSVTLLYL